MANVKIILKKDARKDGTFPLTIRVTKNRRAFYIYLEYSILETDWNAEQQRVKRSHPNATRLNNYLLKKLAEATNDALTLETAKSDVSAGAVKHKIQRSNVPTIFTQAEDYLNGLKGCGKYNQYTADKPRIAHFKKFLKHGDIAFSDLTVSLLERFVGWLKHGYKNEKTGKRLGERSIMNHLVAIRSVFAHAKKNKFVTREQSPFGENGIKIKFPDTTKVGITAESIAKLERVFLDDSAHNHARNLWLLSFYFAGMRVSDLLQLKWADFQDFRLHYVMGKNNKGGSLRAPEKAISILRQYEAVKGNECDLIFPDLRGIDLSNEFTSKRAIAFKTSAIDKILRLQVAPKAGVDSKVTMHIARHTFATLASDTIPIQMLQKLYRHSHVSTTIAYQQNFIHKNTDAALDSVLGKVSSLLEK